MRKLRSALEALPEESLEEQLEQDESLPLVFPWPPEGYDRNPVKSTAVQCVSDEATKQAAIKEGLVPHVA